MILGQVLTAGQGQNPARQAAIKAGLPIETPAITINQVCGSGLRAVAMGFQAIRAGDAGVVVAGGQESMSLSTHCAHLRGGTKMGALEFVDTMIKDGLWDAFNGYHMGTTAENVAQKWQITREEQDRVRRRVAAEGGRGAGGRPVQGRDRPGHGQDPEGRGGGRQGRAPQARHHGGGAGQAAPGVQQGRHGHRRQRLGPQRRRLGDGADDAPTRRSGAGSSRWRGSSSWATAGVDPAIMGTGPDPGLAQGAGEGRLEGRATSTWSRPTRRSPPRPARSTRTSAGTRPR